jgi:type 1 glutamine amidotransferase
MRLGLTHSGGFRCRKRSIGVLHAESGSSSIRPGGSLATFRASNINSKTVEGSVHKKNLSETIRQWENVLPSARDGCVRIQWVILRSNFEQYQAVPSARRFRWRVYWPGRRIREGCGSRPAGRAEAQTNQKMKILVVHGDAWHPPIISQNGLAALHNPQYDFTWANSITEDHLKKISAYDAVILVKSNDLSETDQKGWMQESAENSIREYVRGGRGFLAIHSGIAEYENNHMYRNILGGVFHHHPDQCAVTLVPKEGHPLTMGVTSFTEKDEHYFLSGEDPTVDIFMTASSEHGSQPAGWRRMEGTGRIAVITPGHNPEVWANSAFRTLLQNVIDWCGGIA